MGKMFGRLRSVFGRRKSHAAVAATTATVSEPYAGTRPQGLTAEDEIVSALASASQLPSETIDQETSDAIQRIATLLAEEPPKLKRGNPGGQEFTVKLTYNQKEWINGAYEDYVNTYSLAPFQRVMQVFVEKYISSVEERVNQPAVEITQTEFDTTASEA